MKFLKLGVLFLIATAFTFPKPTKIGYNFKVGSTVEWTQNVKQSMKQSIPGMGDMDTNTEVKSGLSVKVLEKTSTGAKLEVIIPKLTVDIKSAMIGNVSLDSEGDQGSPFNKVMKAMTGTPLTLTISALGVVEKVEGVDKVKAAIEALALDANVKAAATQVVDQFTAPSYFQLYFIQYPTVGVETGGTWKSSYAALVNFPNDIQITSTLTKIDGKVLTIDGDGTLTTPKDKQFNANGFKATSDITGRMAVKSKANLDTGWPSELKSVSELKGNIKILAGGQLPEDMDVPTEMTIEYDQAVKQ
ncbi:DUF6263 family protein [Pseudochryseolinea flava]|uniref:Uncharacterized protein n=1 Tax=Pseudochryseolinea flava TaxID=2059302 RepID=A0A364YAF1_9BACT|nr:DUF6263 family protein [Pseudochryseolinea flava]RAW03132.1 hypothetical protein DQQ10_03275 [Pseudochryseolinea flava]